MDKIKNIDWKRIGVDHGEKIGIAIVGLIAVFSLLQTSWATYDRSSKDLETLAQTTRQAMESSSWPKDRASGAEHGWWEFQDIADIETRAERMGRSVGFERYAFSTPMVWPLVPPRQKRSQLLLASAEDVVVDFVADAFAMKKVATSATDEKSGKSDGSNDDEKPKFNFRGGSRTRGGSTSPGSGRDSGLLGGGSGGLGMGAGGDADSGLSGGGSGGLGMGAGGDADSGLSGGGSGGLGMGSGQDSGLSGGGGLGLGSGGATTGGSASARTPDFKAEGHRVAAVRAVVDVYKQRELVSRSLHLPISDPQVKNALVYVDFHVQRQEATRGGDPWGGDWHDVDVQIARNIVRTADGRDDDVVSRDVTDPGITMPLPPRLLQPWGEEASHPRIENFQLSESQKERQRLKDSLVRKYYDEYVKKQKASLSRPKRGGWHRDTLDLDEMQKTMQSDKKTYDEFKKEYQETLRKKGFSTADHPSASGSLLLFRYLDFSIEPGRQYRYRVQVEIENPNYGVPLDQLEDPSLGERMTLRTDWSEPSPPLAVPYDYYYFVDSVSEKPEGDEAEVNMYYWYYETGTTVAADGGLDIRGSRPLKVEAGDFVGGTRKNVYVLRLDTETLNQETVRFESQDLLLNVREAPVLDPAVFTDLKTEIASLGRQRKVLGPRITVSRPDGEVLTMTAGDREADLQFRREYMKAMMEEFDSWKDADTSDDSEGSLLGGSSRRRKGRSNRRSNPGDPYGGDDNGGGGSGGPPPGYGDGAPPGYGGDGDNNGPPPGYGDSGDPGSGSPGR